MTEKIDPKKLGDQVVKVLKTTWITQGIYVENFEEYLKKKFGSKYVVALSSGTAGLHLSALALNWSKNDIILLSPITFLATANCVLYTKACLDSLWHFFNCKTKVKFICLKINHNIN